MISFLPLGGAQDIGASSYYLNLDGTGIILDCGTHPRKKGIDSLPAFDLIKNAPVDCALISHAHQDHIDGLPYLVQRHPYIRIIATPQTRAVAEITLHNSVGILREQLMDEITIRPYTHEEVDLLIQSIEWKSYREEFDIHGYRHQGDEPVRCSFLDAGHILGSAGTLLQYKGKSIFYTGDINLEKRILFPGASLPDSPVDVLILETTHGMTPDADLPPREEEFHRLAQKANLVLSRGGSILLPVFALGKMQEVLVALWKMMEQGTLARHDMYTGGIGKKISTVYDKNRYVVPYNDTDLIISDIPQKDLYDVEHDEEFFRRPCIVLAGSGMIVEGTLSYRLAQRWLSHTKSSIFTVGYMDPETPGYRIRSASKGDLLQVTDSSEPVNVRCDIDQFRISAHSGRTGLLSIVKKLKPKTVILVHGESHSVDWMGHAILTAFPSIKVHAAEIGKPLSLFD